MGLSIVDQHKILKLHQYEKFQHWKWVDGLLNYPLDMNTSQHPCYQDAHGNFHHGNIGSCGVHWIVCIKWQLINGDKFSFMREIDERKIKDTIGIIS